MSQVTYDAGQMLLTVADDGVERALGALAGKTAAVLKVAINRTARESRKDIFTAAEERYALTAKGKARLRRLKQRRKATDKDLVAELRQDDKGLPLDYAYFEHRPLIVRKGQDVLRNSPEYHRAHALKSDPMKELGAEGGKSKGFLVEFKSGHVGMVQRMIGVKSASETTERGYRRWKNSAGIVEKIKTMSRPGGSTMGRAVWYRGVDETAAEKLEQFVDQRIQQVIDRARRK